MGQTDAEYGSPLNLCKTIAAVDFLTLISSLNTAKISEFIPDSTPESKAPAACYVAARYIAVRNLTGYKVEYARDELISQTRRLEDH